MSQLVCINDIQIKNSEPFFSATRDFLQWVIDQEWNNSNNYLWLNGDQYESSSPANNEVELIQWFLNKCKFKKVYLSTGNHDISFNSGNALKPLEAGHDHVQVIDFPEIIKIDNLNILGLPYMQPHQLSNDLTMKHFYENLPEEFTKEHYTHCFGHFEDETVAFNSKGININYLNIDKIYNGHIHLAVNERYRGVPVIRTYAEVGQHNKILIIDTVTQENTELEVPKFLDYIDIDYPNDLDFNKWKYPIFNISSCPDKQLVRTYYNNKYKDKDNVYIREYNVTKLERKDNNLTGSDNSKKGITEYLDEFLETLENASDEVKDLCIEGVR